MSEFSVAERTMPELSDDMTVADLVDVLEHLRFPGGQPSTVRIAAFGDDDRWLTIPSSYRRQW